MTSPWAIESPEFRSKLADLPALFNSELLTAADSYATHFLTEQGISDEPVAWVPATFPHGWASPMGNLVQGPRAEINLFRVLRESALASGSVPPALLSGVCAARRILRRESLRVLYVEQRQSLAHIANRYGLSRQMVTRLAYEYDITIRRPGRPRRD